MALIHHLGNDKNLERDKFNLYVFAKVVIHMFCAQTVVSQFDPQCSLNIISIILSCISGRLDFYLWVLLAIIAQPKTIVQFCFGPYYQNKCFQFLAQRGKGVAFEKKLQKKKSMLYLFLAMALLDVKVYFFFWLDL